ncbi:hypothetical protein O2N63_10825 [Aliiroseovarius sp. KMU-50]|uniref:Uncharacterized protein n=1 Tax=Aliiroseovarius salicola TaxID=3009082 RepID=A0ABT4W4B8_9RHOB|nr:hypothetical protein [Aliiroseovarius sp. KMU-50]MDA5094578.1 hypothetical protein [Aliiroseovarius sp. KMU-50]
MNELIAAIDKRGLIRESYKIDGIRAEECRSIFLDWALFDEHEMPQPERIKLLLDAFGSSAPDHPMTTVMQDALKPAQASGRRGGRNGRVKNS